MERFKRLENDSKHFIDTVKMIAYHTEADIIPNKIVTIRIHHMANQSENITLKYLNDELNGTETLFPKTNMKMRCKLVS
ncbi:MAG: hypothetical protein HQK83_18740 [Fibrobacteria bacterium]|nr:hypothetical protein [Fibrobacteria bacterium]